MRAQTIQIFLPTGNPKGLRHAEITTRTVRVYEVPRSDLKEFVADPFAGQPGVYFLVGEDAESDDERPALYVGESDEVAKRLTQHDVNKSFWDRAYVAVSLTNSWTKAHTRQFELDALEKAKLAASHRLTNGTVGFARSLPAPVMADCREFFETIEILLATLGASFLEVPASSEETPTTSLLLIDHEGGRATGNYSSAGFTVFSGSAARPVVSGLPKITERRNQLLTQGVLAPQGDGYAFTRDHVFRSPSGAAGAVLGRSANGWTEWKDVNGVTLDAIERPPVVGAVP
ncbi:GIY-YIG nuclease family protein [Salinibacterium sp. SYSU T00001]|uniref:GIY-YIG nuclease family protein n=1 Tax=Homoserinimonas sedimenticola TaxID=2986805 RepID=UPI002235853F|nr:GIY-YIG nuclease family protein [Salinibacterium sedimenticola]MCW4384465.1 GIY-YIG nuclease family protein [Salinibacterium sedimenticola]